MSQKTALRRYSIIINELRKKKSTYNEICAKLQRESELDGYDYVISKRTMKRDIEDIYYLYGIEICFDFSQRVYYIQDEEDNIANLKVLEAFDIINAFNLSADNERYVHFDKRQPQGTHHLLPILDAIKKRNCMEVLHQKFADQNSTSRLLEPLALKESEYRWYLIARDKADGEIKTFGLDRILYIEITKKKFTYPKNFDVNEFFRYSYGIVSGKKNAKPQRIILAFSGYWKPYLLTLPLHHTQEVVKDTNTEFCIQLYLFPTQDLLRELASYGNQVAVLQPLYFKMALEEFTQQNQTILPQ